MDKAKERAKRVSLNKYITRIPYFILILLLLSLVFILTTSAVFFKKQAAAASSRFLESCLRDNREILAMISTGRDERESKITPLFEHPSLLEIEIFDADGILVLNHRNEFSEKANALFTLSPVVVEKTIDQNGTHWGKLRLTMSTSKESAVLQTIALTLMGIFLLVTAAFFLFTRNYNKEMNKELLLLRNSIEKKVEAEQLHTHEFNIEELALFQRKIKHDSKALKGLKEELEKKENLALIGNFASSVVHDIRNPLSVISGYAELLSDRLPDTEKQFPGRILHSSRNIARLLEDILKFVKEQKLELKMETHKPEMVVQAALEFLEPVINRKSVKVAREMDAGLILLCDIDRLSRAVMNLVKNSVEISRTGDTITLKTYKEGKTVIFSVYDQGPGIPESIKETIFEPFATADKRKGTGLGLFIVKNIVEAHNGIVTFETAPTGTEFFIKIPV